MGRGRAPCCDKSKVITGPWSPAEDLKLMTFIQKYGHDNWRALPRQAGLARCGKSCRLRWVNYLRPDLKRGNFTKQEEDSIIQLHQTIGNKWSKIASHFPGRTDNEIKNVWNTHLKKRLAKKAVEDVTKESSVITSSSSSSATVESNSKSQKCEIESQIKLTQLEDSEMKTDETWLTEMALTPSHQNTVASQVTAVHGCESFNEFDPISQQSEQLLNSSGIDQFEQFTIWDDTSLLESMMNEVEDASWLLAPENTQNGSTGNNSSCQLPIESDFDFWSMLNNDVIPAPAKPDQIEVDHVHNMEAPMSKKSMKSLHDYMDDKDINSMFEYLKNESGLADQSVGVRDKQIQHQKDDVNNSFLAVATGTSEVYKVTNMNDFTIWPQSPIYF